MRNGGTRLELKRDVYLKFLDMHAYTYIFGLNIVQKVFFCFMCHTTVEARASATHSLKETLSIFIMSRGVDGDR